MNDNSSLFRICFGLLTTLITSKAASLSYDNEIRKSDSKNVESDMKKSNNKYVVSNMRKFENVSESATPVPSLSPKTSKLETTTFELKKQLTHQPDPEVTTHDNITIESSYHDCASHSVQNSKQEPELPLENQHLSIINQNNISNST